MPVSDLPFAIRFFAILCFSLFCFNSTHDLVAFSSLNVVILGSEVWRFWVNLVALK